MTDNTSNSTAQTLGVSTSALVHKPKLIIMRKSTIGPVDKQKDQIEEQRIRKIPIPRIIPDKKELLRRWLGQRCSYSEDLFKDPGYSNYYKNEFNIMDGFGTRPFYQIGDIDDELNMGYVDYSVGAEKDEDDIVLEQFIDYIPAHIPVNMPRTARSYEETCEKLWANKKNILILPGSNHSNANFLFKRINRHIRQYGTLYSIPYVSASHTTPYKKEHKTAKMEVNKEQLYEFLRKHSKNQ